MTDDLFSSGTLPGAGQRVGGWGLCHGDQHHVPPVSPGVLHGRFNLETCLFVNLFLWPHVFVVHVLSPVSCHVIACCIFFLLLPCLALFLVRYIRSCLVAGVAPSFYDVLFKNLVPLWYWVTSWNTSTVLFPVMHLVFMIRFSLFSVISSHFMIHFPCFLSSPITSTCIFLVSCLLKSVHHAFFLFPVFSRQFIMHFSCFLSSPITSSCIFLVSCLLKSVHDAFSLFAVFSSQFMMHFPCFLSSQVSSWCIFLVSCHLKSLYDVFSLCYLQLWCFKSFSFFLLLFVCGVFVTYVCVCGGVLYMCVCVCVCMYVCVLVRVSDIRISPCTAQGLPVFVLCLL